MAAMMAPTPHRTIRVPDDLWTAAQARAAERGETLTDVVLRALREYVSDQAPTETRHTEETR